MNAILRRNTFKLNGQQNAQQNKQVDKKLIIDICLSLQMLNIKCVGKISVPIRR